MSACKREKVISGHKACGRRAHLSGIGGKPGRKGNTYFCDRSLGSEMLLQARTKSLEVNINP